MQNSFLAQPTALTSMQSYMLANLAWWQEQNKAQANSIARPLCCITQAYWASRQFDAERRSLFFSFLSYRKVISKFSAWLNFQLSSSCLTHITFCAILFWHDAFDATGSSMDLVALLYEPAGFEAQPKEASAGSSDSKMPVSLAPSVLDALHGLSQQCIVFKKSAEQLGRHSLLCACAALHG